MNPALYFWGFILLGVCIGIPFSINLCGEVLLIGACIQIGLFFCLVMVIYSVFTVAYSLYFFGCLFHGRVSECIRVYDIEMVSVFIVVGHVVCAFLRVFLCDFFF